MPERGPPIWLKDPELRGASGAALDKMVPLLLLLCVVNTGGRVGFDFFRWFGCMEDDDWRCLFRAF